ncbi:stp_2 [Symbiodinium sp. CCMP2456]|nr:stp_2 [Symbiodinium sp. CCMP2456]
MGTTCSCLVLTQGAAIVGHVGDSRVYRLRHRVLEQLTFDHSLVWEMAAASKVSADRVPACIPKNVITRSLGPHETVMIDLEGPHELCDGDIFLLCSDGLSGVVEDPMAGSLLSVLEPEAAAEALVNLANLRGGPDNISVIVARVQKSQSAALGNGPYRRTECGDHAAAAGDLRDLVRELSSLRSEEDTVRPEDAATNGHPKAAPYYLDWEPFRALQQTADAAFERGDHLGAIKHYAEIIADAMALVRGDDNTRRYAAHGDGVIS